jgi:hypothetical protein
MYEERSVPLTGLRQRQHSPFQDAAVPPDISKHRKTVTGQKSIDHGQKEYC